MNTEGKNPVQSFTYWILPKWSYQISPGLSGSYRIFTGHRVQYRENRLLRVTPQEVEANKETQY